MLHTEMINYGLVTLYLLYYDNFIVEEHINDLLPDELESLKLLKHPSRRREYIATRVLRTLHFGKTPILYSEIGAPSIEKEGFISISHNNLVAGIAYCNSFQVGLDIEPIHEKVMRVKHKFLGENEKKQNDTSSIEEMIKIWSGKETLYKLASRKKIIFKENLFLTPINKRIWNGEIVFQNSKKEVELTIDKRNDFVISINTSPIHEVY